MAEVDQIPGRMERFGLPGGALAVVDYAHTPDALAAILAAGRELIGGDLILVFGCGGDRDRGKRPLMGQVAVRLADRVWITSDNPRTEDPQAIIGEIARGIPSRRWPDTSVLVDRQLAIETAIDHTRPGDVVLIAGKGHEPYQIVGTERLPFDDRDEARHALAHRGCFG